MGEPSKESTTKDLFTWFYLFLSPASFFYGLYILGNQLIVYLKEGIWNKRPLAEPLLEFFWKIIHYFPGFESWLNYPKNWFGLHEVLQFFLLLILLLTSIIPLSVFFMFIIPLILTRITKRLASAGF